MCNFTDITVSTYYTEAENLGVQGGLSPTFLIRGGAEPPKMGGCHEECLNSNSLLAGCIQII